SRGSSRARRCRRICLISSISAAASPIAWKARSAWAATRASRHRCPWPRRRTRAGGGVLQAKHRPRGLAATLIETKLPPQSRRRGSPTSHRAPSGFCAVHSKHAARSRVMRFVPRLLPIVIGAAAFLLCAKIADIWLAIGIGPLATARAQTAAEHAKPARTAAAEPASTEAASPPGNKRTPRDPMTFSPQEIEILQSLAQRRDDLDKRAAEVDRHEAMLQATEQRIDAKIAKLQEMEGKINDAFR